MRAHTPHSVMSGFASYIIYYILYTIYYILYIIYYILYIIYYILYIIYYILYIDELIFVDCRKKKEKSHTW